MPKKIIDYSTTEIYFYKLCCNDISVKDIYIGHTTNFTKRKACHKNACNIAGKYYNLNVYKFIRNNGGWNNWSMVLLDRIKCQDKLDALKYERDLIERHNATLNKNIPSRTTREYRENNKDKISEYKKIYRENNKDKISKYNKNYREKRQLIKLTIDNFHKIKIVINILLINLIYDIFNLETETTDDESSE